MNRGSLLIGAVGLALAGCATVAGTSNLDWTYKPDSGTGTPDGPMALWGAPETMAFHALRCNVPARTLDFEDIEVEEFAGGRPIRLEAGGQVWDGEQRLKPPDGVAVAVAGVPIDHPVVAALGNGAPLRVTGADGSFGLPTNFAVRRVVRECRAAILTVGKS